MRLAWLALLAAPLLADTQFTARRVSRNDIPLGRGQCEIRIQVDNEAEVSIDGDRVHIRAISGRDGRDDGSWCNDAMPGRNIRDFNFEVLEKRGGGEIVLLDDPSSRGRAFVRIRDSKSGEGRYHFRLNWSITGGAGGSGRPRRGFGNAGGQRDEARAIRTCEDAVRGKIASDYRMNRVEVRGTRLEGRPGRDSYVGQATGRRGGELENFSFACRVDSNSGEVQSVDVERR
jgi:hypothetical protein